MPLINLTMLQKTTDATSNYIVKLSKKTMQKKSFNYISLHEDHQVKLYALLYYHSK